MPQRALHGDLAQLGAGLIVQALDRLEHGKLPLQPQPTEGATYAAKITREETRIDWRRPWREVHDHCRGLSPFPGAVRARSRWQTGAGEGPAHDPRKRLRPARHRA
jgi:methionyl-tRNA formyltransferase